MSPLLTQRGQRRIYLSEPTAVPSYGLGPEGRQPPAPDTDHTHYWCKIYRAPEVTTKHHMISRSWAPHPAWSRELRASHGALLPPTLPISHQWRQTPWGHHLQSKVHICTHNGALTWIAPNYVNPSTCLQDHDDWGWVFWSADLWVDWVSPAAREQINWRQINLDSTLVLFFISLDNPGPRPVRDVKHYSWRTWAQGWRIDSFLLSLNSNVRLKLVSWPCDLFLDLIIQWI